MMDCEETNLPKVNNEAIPCDGSYINEDCIVTSEDRIIPIAIRKGTSQKEMNDILLSYLNSLTQKIKKLEQILGTSASDNCSECN